MNLLKFEKYINTQIFNYIFNNEIYESAGHPLFNESDDKSLEFISKIKNIFNIINNKLSISKDNGKTYTAKFNDKKLNARCYKINILLDKLGFTDIIYSPGAKLNLIVYDIFNSDKLSNDDYNVLYTGSSGKLIWYSNDKINKRKFVTDSDKMEITCYAINGKILPHSFLPIFLHEYLHFYENFNRTKLDKHKKFISDLHTHKSIYNNDKIKNHLEDDELTALKRILYVLFYGEDNARIGTLFGHLISYNIETLRDFYDNKKYIYYFTEYEKLKKYFDIVKNIDDDTLFYIFEKSNFFRGANKMPKDISSMTPRKVKKWFIDIIELKLKKFYEKGMKFVGRYINMLNNYKDNNFIYKYTFDEDYNNEFVNNLISEK